MFITSLAQRGSAVEDVVRHPERPALNNSTKLFGFVDVPTPCLIASIDPVKTFRRKFLFETDVKHLPSDDTCLVRDIRRLPLISKNTLARHTLARPAGRVRKFCGSRCVYEIYTLRSRS